MERGLILLIAALVVYVAPDVQGSSHLSFSNDSMVNITRDGCGMSKLCVSQPDNCNPNATGNCLFASVVSNNSMPPNGSDMYFELRGYSMGYVGLGLTQNASEGTTMLFICAQNSSNNGSFFFRTRQKNNTNGTLMANERTVKDIRGKVDGNVIKCKFMVPYVNASMNKASTDTTFTILLGNGTYDPASLGRFNTQLNSGRLNLSDPAANIATATTAAPNTTTANTTMSSGGAVHPHAVLSLLSVFTLFGMLRA